MRVFIFISCTDNDLSTIETLFTYIHDFKFFFDNSYRLFFVLFIFRWWIRWFCVDYFNFFFIFNIFSFFHDYIIHIFLFYVMILKIHMVTSILFSFIFIYIFLFSLINNSFFFLFWCFIFVFFIFLFLSHTLLHENCFLQAIQ